MGFILLTELESTGSITCKIKGLDPKEIEDLEVELRQMKIITSTQPDFFEADTDAVKILNLLQQKLHYQFNGSQSMVIEKPYIGGRTVQTQKIVWTLHK